MRKGLLGVCPLGLFRDYVIAINEDETFRGKYMIQPATVLVYSGKSLTFNCEVAYDRRDIQT